MEILFKLITKRFFTIANARVLRSPELFLQTLPFSHLQVCLKEHYHIQLNLRKYPLQEERMSVIRLSDVGGKKTATEKKSAQ